MSKHEKLSLEEMLDKLPENRSLLKDSGLWGIYEQDGDNEGIFSQGVDESFMNFIRRCLSVECRECGAGCLGDRELEKNLEKECKKNGCQYYVPELNL